MSKNARRPIGRVWIVIIAIMLVAWWLWPRTHVSATSTITGIRFALPSNNLAARATSAYQPYFWWDPEIEQKVAQVLQHRPSVEAAARQHGVPDMVLYGIICTESAGNQWAHNKLGIAGLCQFKVQTAREYGLHVNRGESNHYRGIRETCLRHLRSRLSPSQRVAAEKIRSWAEANLTRSDERYNPAKAIMAQAWMVADQERRFQRLDQAVAAYHMGIGNMQAVIREYCRESGLAFNDVRTALNHHRLTWINLIDSADPVHHPKTWRILHHELQDSSWDYYLKVMASGNAVITMRDNPSEFLRLMQQFHPGGATRRWELAHELVWYPPNSPSVTRWASAADLEQAVAHKKLVRLWSSPDLGFEIDKNIGDLAPQYRTSYQTVPRTTCGLLFHLARATRGVSTSEPIRVTSMTRSLGYQERVSFERSYSTHCAGASFDIAPPRDHRPKAQLEYQLMQLRLRNLVAYAHEFPGQANDHYHVTLAPDTEAQALFGGYERQIMASLTPPPNPAWPWYKTIAVWILGILGVIYVAVGVGLGGYAYWGETPYRNLTPVRAFQMGASWPYLFWKDYQKEKAKRPQYRPALVNRIKL